MQKGENTQSEKTTQSSELDSNITHMLKLSEKKSKYYD